MKKNLVYMGVYLCLCEVFLSIFVGVDEFVRAWFSMWCVYVSVADRSHTMSLKIYLPYIVRTVVDSCRRTGSVRQPMTFDRVVYQVVGCKC